VCPLIVLQSDSVNHVDSHNIFGGQGIFGKGKERKNNKLEGAAAYITTQIAKWELLKWCLIFSWEWNKE